MCSCQGVQTALSSLSLCPGGGETWEARWGEAVWKALGRTFYAHNLDCKEF